METGLVTSLHPDHPMMMMGQGPWPCLHPEVMVPPVTVTVTVSLSESVAIMMLDRQRPGDALCNSK